MDKLLDSLLNKLDWNFITEIYNNRMIMWEHSKSDSKIPTKDEIYNELKGVLHYIIEDDVPHYFLDIFLIIYTNEDEIDEDNLVISLLHDTVLLKGIKRVNSDNICVIESESDLILNDMSIEYDNLVNERRYEEAMELNKTIELLKERL